MIYTIHMRNTFAIHTFIKRKPHEQHFNVLCEKDSQRTKLSNDSNHIAQRQSKNRNHTDPTPYSPIYGHSEIKIHFVAPNLILITKAFHMCAIKSSKTNLCILRHALYIPHPPVLSSACVVNCDCVPSGLIRLPSTHLVCRECSQMSN